MVLDQQRGTDAPASRVVSATVVLVHGIWMPGAELMMLKNRLESEHGLRSVLFSYKSVRGTLAENTERLAEFVRQQATGRTHLVGHSLGGVLSLRTLALNPQLSVDRVVCLGSPLTGSRAAMVVDSHKWGHTILGKTVAGGVVDQTAADWSAAVTDRHEVGVVAGTVGIGLGKIVTRFGGGESDGVVAVAETHLPGIRDHIRMPVNHTGLVFSRSVASQVAAFLDRGEFLREP